jgi:hypothetical protein
MEERLLALPKESPKLFVSVRRGAGGAADVCRGLMAARRFGRRAPLGPSQPLLLKV